MSDSRRHDELIDDATVQGMRIGVDWAWASAWSSLAAPLVAFVRSMGAGATEAEDLVAEAFTRMLAHRQRLPDDPRAVRAWAFAIARNLLIDDRRSARHRSSTSIEPADAVTRDGRESSEVADVSTDVVLNALAALPDRQRGIVLLHVYGDLTLSEAAYVLGISHAAARKAFSRAAEHLRSAITPDD